MKKFLSISLICAVLFMPSNSLFATSNDVSFFDALGNFTAIEDHKLIQSFYGNAEFEEYGDHISADYRISISSVVDEGNRKDSSSRLSAFLKLTNHSEVNDSTPFKEMTVQANGEIIAKNQEEFYFKLNNFNIGLTEPLPFAVVDIENAKASVDLYRGIWYHTTAAELSYSEFEEEIDLEKYIELEEKLKEEPKQAIIELSELALYDSGEAFTTEEIENFIEAISLALKTQLFTERDVVSGYNLGFKFFNLNKGEILNLVAQIAKVFNEEMTTSDEEEIRAALSKVSISGIYRVEDVFHVIDNLLVRLKLREVGPLLNFEMNYRYKLSDINKENSVKAPSEFEEWISPYETEEF